MNGMDNNYTRWIHHGESLDLDVIEHPNDMHDNVAGVYGQYVTEDDGADRLEGMLGDLHTAATEQARDDGENQDGDIESHHQESFLKNNHERGKSSTLSWMYQIFKILFCGTASSYEIAI